MTTKPKRGFTLIELLVVLGIIALLLTLAVPRFFPSVDRGKETILASNLRNMREVIDRYYEDNGRYPDTLDQLVERKYIAALPYDPITESNSTWIVVPPDDLTKGSVYTIKSGAPGNDSHGKPFADW